MSVALPADNDTVPRGEARVLIVGDYGGGSGAPVWRPGSFDFWAHSMGP